MSTGMIGEIVAGYGAAARRLAEAGADGVEIVASHGYLPAQLWSAKINQRDDHYGGPLDNRLRFTREAIAAVRAEVPAEFIVGMRFSGDEHDVEGIGEDEIDRHRPGPQGRARLSQRDRRHVRHRLGCRPHRALDASCPCLCGALRAPSSSRRPAPLCSWRAASTSPTTPRRIIAEGAADMCGMTRAMIADPEMPNKARAGAVDDIRACIACNQACIGHFQLGLPISCIQYPETGRELLFAAKPRVPNRAASWSLAVALAV